MTAVLNFDPKIANAQPARLTPANYAKTYADVEQQFIQLVTLKALDQQIADHPALTQAIDRAIAAALPIAYSDDNAFTGQDAAHLFLQRILYHINRLNLFWYDDLHQYQNERSLYLQAVRAH